MEKEKSIALKERMKNVPVWGKLLAGFLITILVMLAAELIANRGYLKSPADQRGVKVLSDQEITAYGFVPTDEGYVYTGEANQLHLELGGRYVGKLEYSYEYEGLLDAYVTYSYLNDYDVSEQWMLMDKNSSMIHTSVVNINKRIEWVDIYTDPSLLLEDGMTYIDLGALPLTITEVKVVNEFFWNPYRMAAILLAGILLTVFIVFRAFFTKKLEFAFLLLSLTAGILMITCMPASKVCWDEEMHFENSYRLSLYPGGELQSPEFEKLFSCYMETWPLSLPEAVEEKQQINEAFDELFENAEKTQIVKGGTCNVQTAGYLAPAVFLKVGRALHMKFTTLYQFGRLGGLLFYCILMFFAIRIIPVGKKLLMMMGLMPTAMFLASCYSYDNVVICCTSLGLALLLREILEKDRPFSWLYTGLAAFFLCWGIFPKAIYAPLALIGLLIPADKFKNKKLVWVVRAGVVLVFLLLMASFMLPRLLSPGSYGDTRGGAVSFSGQMSNILHDPVAYTKILIKNMWDNLPSMFFGTAIFQLMGHWGAAGFQSVSLIFVFWIIAISSFGKNKVTVKPFQKFWILLMSLGCVALVWTAMYMSYTVPGASVIAGVQGRYFLPLFVPILLLFMGERRIKITEQTAGLSLICGSWFLIYACILFTMIAQRCS